jgi:hypothetical protein
LTESGQVLQQLQGLVEIEALGVLNDPTQLFGHPGI